MQKQTSRFLPGIMKEFRRICCIRKKTLNFISELKFINNRAKVSLFSPNRVFSPKIEGTVIPVIKGGHVNYAPEKRFT